MSLIYCKMLPKLCVLDVFLILFTVASVKPLFVTSVVMCCFSGSDDEGNVGVILIKSEDMPADVAKFKCTVSTTTLERAMCKPAINLSFVALVLIALGMSDRYEVRSLSPDPECGRLYLVYKSHEREYLTALIDLDFSKELDKKKIKLLRKNKGYRRIFVLCKKMDRDAVGFVFKEVDWRISSEASWS